MAAEIRARRAELATAFNGADTLAMDRLTMSGFVFVGDRGGSFTAGDLREQVRHFGGSWRRGLSVRVWTPRTIREYAPWKIAVETGDVLRISRSTTDAPADSVRSVYTAQWYRGPQGWQIQAEIDSPIACSGKATVCGSR